MRYAEIASRRSDFPAPITAYPFVARLWLDADQHQTLRDWIARSNDHNMYEIDPGGADRRAISVACATEGAREQFRCRWM